MVGNLVVIGSDVSKVLSPYCSVFVEIVVSVGVPLPAVNTFKLYPATDVALVYST